MSMTRQETLNAVLASGAVAVVRMADAGRLVRVAEAIAEGGVTAIEVTMTTPNALAVIEEVSPRARRRRHRRRRVRARRRDGAPRRRRRGALRRQPRLQAPRSSTRPTGSASRPCPGASRRPRSSPRPRPAPTTVKVFPADVLGMAFFRGVLAPMPHLSLMPTGGVCLTNAGDWVRAGAVAVGVGAPLLDKRAIADGDYARSPRTPAPSASRSRTAARTDDPLSLF